MSVEISVVVRAFNEARHLPRLIDALRGQTAPSFETILVDSGSTDETVDLGRAAFDKLVQLDSRDFTYGYSLNRGIAEASGRFVAIVSAHAFPADDSWLATLVAPLEESNVALAYGCHLPVAETKLSERREFEQLFGTVRRVQRRPHYFCNNGNAAIRRDLWEEHPYDETLTGVEDQGWAKHWLDRGWTIVYEPNAAVYHVHEETWKQIERRYYREAFARRQLQIDRRLQIPRRLVKTAADWVGDVASLPRHGRVGPRAVAEVTSYRYRQARGELRGLIHDYDPVAEHHELYFDRGHEAVVIRDRNDAVLDQRPLPDVKPNDVLIKVSYVGVCSTDLEVLEGKLGYYRSGRATYPIVPGHEYSGVVVRTGANVSGVTVGDKVVGACILSCFHCRLCLAGNTAACVNRREVGVLNHDGAYAEYVVIPSQHVHRLDEAADLAQHVLVEPIAVVHRGLSRSGAAGNGRPLRCAVVGTGPIGNLAVQLLMLHGHDVVAIDRNPARLDALPANVTDRRGEIGGLEDVDLVVEATGTRDALEQVLALDGAGTSVLLLGLPYGSIGFDFESLVAHDKTLIGSVGSGPDDFRAAIELLPRLDLDTFLTMRFPLSRFEDAWRAHRDASALKVILEVAP